MTLQPVTWTFLVGYTVTNKSYKTVKNPKLFSVISVGSNGISEYFGVSKNPDFCPGMEE